MTELETYEHILKVASALIAKKGFADTSMNDIVKTSGVSKGGIYWHFKSKDEIINKIVERMFAEQLHFLDTMLAKEGHAPDRILNLLTMIAESLNQMAENTPSPLDIYALAIYQPDIMAHIKEYFVQYQAHFALLIEQGVQAGDFDVENAEQVAFIFMSSIEGIILTSIVTEQTTNLGNILQETAHLFLKGLGHKTKD